MISYLFSAIHAYLQIIITGFISAHGKQVYAEFYMFIFLWIVTDYKKAFLSKSPLQ